MKLEGHCAASRREMGHQVQDEDKEQGRGDQGINLVNARRAVYIYKPAVFKR